jgi:membrane protease YdiL (CAAX protease family)
VWWAVGGYFVSSWFFNIADFFNSYIFPLSVLEQAEENSIVAKLVNPEGSDIWASIVGYIAPCLTAPWWEEILYRGFLLPALVLQFGTYPLALFVSGVLFSIHHQSELAFLPLCVLGWTWAIVYTKSKNLWTTILIHCMWNSRIFLGSWFGL